MARGSLRATRFQLAQFRRTWLVVAEKVGMEPGGHWLMATAGSSND
jgi:hypothetical protein